MSATQTVVMGTKNHCGMPGCLNAASGDEPVLLCTEHPLILVPVECWMCGQHRRKLGEMQVAAGGAR